MKHGGLILVVLLLGCGPRKVAVTPPAAVADTLTIVYVGNLQDYLLGDSLFWPSASGGTGPGKSITIARFEPVPGLTAEWYGRLGLEPFLSKVYSGVLISAEDFLTDEVGSRPFSLMEAAAGSMVMNLTFGRVGFITEPGSDATDSVYFDYRRNRSITRARSDIIITLAEGPDFVSDTAVSFSLTGGRRVGTVIVADRTVKRLAAEKMSPTSPYFESGTPEELASFRSRMNALRAETLFIHGSNKASNNVEFRKFLAGQIRAFFGAEMTAIPTSVFRKDVGRGRRVFTVDSVAAYVNGRVRFGVRTIGGPEARALVKDRDLLVTGRPGEATTVAGVMPDGIELYDIISRTAQRR